MADLTVSATVDTFMQSANAAQAQAAIAAAPLASPTFTGTPAAPTATGGTNTTQLATTAFVQSAISGVVQVLAGQVANFAALPSAASNSGLNYLVRQSQGVYFVNRKPGGIYTSDGVNWNLDGDATEAYFQDTLAWTNITSKPSTFAPSAHATSHQAGGADPIALDTLAAPTDITTLNASTSAHGLLVKATAPSSGLRNVVGIDNAETAYTNKALFDATNPAALGTAAPGTAMTAARRDHIHARQTAIVNSEIDAAAAIALTKLANIATARILGRLTAGSGAIEELTAANAKTLLALTFADLAAGVLAANVTFGENTEIILDAALSADGKYCGLTEDGIADTTIAFGDLLYFKAANSRWALTDADADSTAGAVEIGICVLASTSGAATKVLRWGKIRADAKFPTFSIGPVYISTTTGEVQSAQPSGTDDVIRIVGYARTTDELFFQPSNDYMTHT